MKTFENQSKLPRLPVPPLANTIAVYLKSVKCHLTPAEHRKYTTVAQDFLSNLGPILQQRLVTHDSGQPNSWLEKWWLQLAYLSWRTTVLVHSNWYMLVRDHPETPAAPYKEGITKFQVYRAAGYATNLLNYMEQINTEKIPPEFNKQGPLDMNQFRNVFGITRVPKAGCDILKTQFPTTSKHIIVLIYDQIFKVPVYDEAYLRLSIGDLEKLIWKCVDSIDFNNLQLPISILTGQDRDDWAKDYEILSKEKANQHTFDVIESALFAVSLDHRLVLPNVTSLAENTFHGFDGHNRWFDKSVSVCVLNDGRLGINGEHSPCDALVPALIFENACKNEPAQDPPNCTSETLDIEYLKWNCNNEIFNSLTRAQSFINKTIADSDVQVHEYKNYGSNFIKKIGGVSPDAYIQTCLQLTFYRIHGYCASVYETASTRKFLHGRTETCRSLTPEQQEFVENFDRPVSNKTRFRLFQRACKAHIAYITEASNGMGCDRHLLGLKMCLREGEKHALFDHPVFAKSSRWQLSTSQLFSSERILGTGFGSAYPDGYGMNYILLPNSIKIGVESKRQNSTTGTDLYLKEFSAVLDAIGSMCKDVNNTIKAKL